MVVEAATTTSDSDSTHLESIAEAVAGHAAALAREANAAGIGSFRTYRRRRLASYARFWSGPARFKNATRSAPRSGGGGPPLAAATPNRSAASRRLAVQPRARNPNMSIFALNMALAVLAALSLAAHSTPCRRFGANEVVKS